MTSVTPSSLPARALATVPDSTRRTVLRSALWAVPAISIASAAPAFATSSSTCINGIATYRTWSVTGGSLDNGSGTGTSATKVATGWLVRGQYGNAGMVSKDEGAWYDGSKSGAGTSNQPEGSFLSFANNKVTSTTTVLVTYGFEVTGTARLTINGTVRLGYGNSGTNPIRTERQLVDVRVRQGTGTATTIAKIAHRRRVGTTTTYYPANSNATTYAGMLQSDPVVTSAGYTMHTATQGQHTYAATYGNSTPLLFTGTGRRTIFVDFVLTLHRRDTTAGLVNDDVIINPPTFSLNCS